MLETVFICRGVTHPSVSLQVCSSWFATASPAIFNSDIFAALPLPRTSNHQLPNFNHPSSRWILRAKHPRWTKSRLRHLFRWRQHNKDNLTLHSAKPTIASPSFKTLQTATGSPRTSGEISPMDLPRSLSLRRRQNVKGVVESWSTYYSKTWWLLACISLSCPHSFA